MFIVLRQVVGLIDTDSFKAFGPYVTEEEAQAAGTALVRNELSKEAKKDPEEANYYEMCTKQLVWHRGVLGHPLYPEEIFITLVRINQDVGNDSTM